MDIPFVRAKSHVVVGANNIIDDDCYFPMNLLIVEKSASQFKSINPNYLNVATQVKLNKQFYK